MREYQVEGLRWMVSRLADAGVNAILADEMVRATNIREGRLPTALALDRAGLPISHGSSLVFQQLHCLRMLDAAPRGHVLTGQERVAYAYIHLIV